MSGRELLIYLSVKYKGDFDKIYKAIKERERMNDEDVRKAVSSIKAKAITILDKEYPDNLKRIFRPPFVLYCYGDISLLKSDKKKIAVIGSRDSSEYGRKVTKDLVSGIAKEMIIISGLAKGIDAVAHKSCIENDGKTIAILGSGIDVIYPNENKHLFEEIKKNHLLVSEYPNDIKPEPTFFPLRNRIIAGCADKLLVTEAYLNSGTNITVMFALRQGKDVMAVPYEVSKNSSCNKLIQDGAYLVETVDDVLFYAK